MPSLICIRRPTRRAGPEHAGPGEFGADCESQENAKWNSKRTLVTVALPSPSNTSDIGSGLIESRPCSVATHFVP